jgi:excisionase family DNA binding protein
MPIAQWTATMEAEDLSEPPDNGGISTGSQTVSLPVRFYSVAQIAGMTALSEDTVRREIRSGDLTAHRFRSRLRVKDGDFEAWTNRSRYRPAEGVMITYELASTEEEEDYRW